MIKLIKILSLVILFLSKSITASELIYLSYSESPTIVYEKEIFSVDYKAIITTDFDRVELSFPNKKDLKPSKFDNNWKTSQNHLYKKELFFKAPKVESLKLPTIRLDAFKDNKIVATGVLEGKNIVVQPISTYSKQFCNVLAENLNVVNYKIRQYNNDFLIIILEINALKSNIEDFNLSEFKEQGIESIKGSMPQQKLFYYALVPNYYSNFVFEYFNLVNKKFKQTTLPIDIENELISTQSGLNPNSGNLDFYKKIFVISVVIIFLSISLYRKKVIYMLFATPFIIYAISIITPPKTAIIKNSTKVQILPTPKSTVFYISQGMERVEILKQRDKYSKIILKNESIGWIKNENIEQINSYFFTN